MIPKIMMTSSSPLDQCAFYRSTGPLSLLEKQGKIRLEINDKLQQGIPFHWVDNRCDILFMHRPWSVGALKIVSDAKFLGVPLWLDYDDDLFTVRHDNASHFHYRNPATQQNIKDICKLADIVTVATPKLKEIFSEFNENVVLIPNALDDSFFKFPTTRERTKNVFWRGSNTHRKDLQTVSEELAMIAFEHKDWGFHFFGPTEEQLWYMAEIMPKENTVFHGMLQMLDYYQVVKEMKPALCVVPLEHDRFNEAKSCIACLEATSFGAVTICPSFGDFENIEGAIKYKTDDGTDWEWESFSFKQSLLDGIEGRIKLGELYDNAKSYIEQERVLSKTNLLRKRIITGMLENDINEDSSKRLFHNFCKGIY